MLVDNLFIFDPAPDHHNLDLVDLDPAGAASGAIRPAAAAIDVIVERGVSLRPLGEGLEPTPRPP